MYIYMSCIMHGIYVVCVCARMCVCVCARTRVCAFVPVGEFVCVCDCLVSV